LAKALSTAPDLVIWTSRCRARNGFEVCRELRAARTRRGGDCWTRALAGHRKGAGLEARRRRLRHNRSASTELLARGPPASCGRAGGRPWASKTCRIGDIESNFGRIRAPSRDSGLGTSPPANSNLLRYLVSRHNGPGRHREQDLNQVWGTRSRRPRARSGQSVRQAAAKEIGASAARPEHILTVHAAGLTNFVGLKTRPVLPGLNPGRHPGHHPRQSAPAIHPRPYTPAIHPRQSSPGHTPDHHPGNNPGQHPRPLPRPLPPAITPAIIPGITPGLRRGQKETHLRSLAPKTVYMECDERRDH